MKVLAWLIFIPAMAVAQTCNLELGGALNFRSFSRLPIPARYELFQKARVRLDAQASIDNLSFWPNLKDKIAIAKNVSLNYWGVADSYDELVKEFILPEETLRLLEIPLHKDSRSISVSAGIMHTYGYLFSLLPTSFGLKSKRWLELGMDVALGLKPGTLGPFPESGEFLSNLTWTLDRITQPTSKGRSCAEIKNVAKSLCRIDAEKGELPRPIGYREQILDRMQVRTYLIPFIQPAATGETFLLAYETIQKSERRWITAFPVTSDFAKTFQGPALKLGSQQTFVPRFNLYQSPDKTLTNVLSDRWVELSF